MRPHNGWWRASSAPRRWIDLVQESSQEANKANVAVQKPAVLVGKPVQAPAA